jgi:hypothetical protein
MPVIQKETARIYDLQNPTAKMSKSAESDAGVPVGEVAGQLDVLLLVVADRHDVGLVQQDVGGHEHRVGEQAHAVRAVARARARRARVGPVDDHRVRRGRPHDPVQGQVRPVRRRRDERTCDCTYSVDFAGSMPAAMYCAAVRRVFSRSSAGSFGCVSACRSTTEKKASYASCRSRHCSRAPM